jgi:hypothetical protein
MKITIIDENFKFLDSEKSNPLNGLTNEEIEQQYINIRKAISKLFYNYREKTSFYMTKTQQSGNFGVYKAKVSTGTLGNQKFIVAIVPDDNLSIGSQKLLESLRWVSFQTRETKNSKKEFNNLDLDLQEFVYTDVPILKDKIHYEKTNRYAYVYIPENLPLKVEIIPLKEDDIYPDQGTVATALNIFSTIINLN